MTCWRYSAFETGGIASAVHEVFEHPASNEMHLAPGHAFSVEGAAGSKSVVRIVSDVDALVEDLFADFSEQAGELVGMAGAGEVPPEVGKQIQYGGRLQYGDVLARSYFSRLVGSQCFVQGSQAERSYIDIGGPVALGFGPAIGCAAPGLKPNVTYFDQQRLSC